MKRILTRLVAGIVLLGAAVLVPVAIGRLRRSAAQPAPLTPAPPFARPEWLRKFVTERFNPLVVGLGLIGGRRSPWGYLEHVGRRTGLVRRTPVLPRVIGGFAYIPLAYGPDVHWARNVQRAGRCRLQVHETVYELNGPTVITASDYPGVSESLRWLLERRGDRYLRLRVVAIRPGTLDVHSPQRIVPAEPLARGIIH